MLAVPANQRLRALVRPVLALINSAPSAASSCGVPRDSSGPTDDEVDVTNQAPAIRLCDGLVPAAPAFVLTLHPR